MVINNTLDVVGTRWNTRNIIAHNHPSGIAEPSSADKALTERLRGALELIDIRVLDHFVIGEGEIVSMAERGLM